MSLVEDKSLYWVQTQVTICVNIIMEWYTWGVIMRSHWFISNVSYSTMSLVNKSQLKTHEMRHENLICQVENATSKASWSYLVNFWSRVSCALEAYLMSKTKAAFKSYFDPCVMRINIILVVLKSVNGKIDFLRISLPRGNF